MPAATAALIAEHTAAHKAETAAGTTAGRLTHAAADSNAD
jgi:hypothetical protein